MTPGQIATRPIRAEDCAVAFGVPTSETSFRAARQDGNESSFAWKYSCFPHYDRGFLHPYRTATRSIARMGARIVPDLSLDVLEELFLSPDLHVVILFSHWHDTGVEMSGGFAGVSDIVRRVPPDAAKVLDLTVCQCRLLAKRLVKDRSTCPVRYALKEGDQRGIELEPAFWLGLLRAVFLRLKRGSKTYPQAWAEVVRGEREHLLRRH